MADKPRSANPAADGTEDRAARLMAAMRANLQRRKQQQRARDTQVPATGAAEPVEPG